MVETGVERPKAEQCFLYTLEVIEIYLQKRQSEGVADSAIVKYRDALKNLYLWLGDNLRLDAVRLQQWRLHLESFGYSKHTVQRYITRVNNFLHYYERDDLHIPKPVRNDLTGRSFGYLTVLEQTEQRHHKYVVWRCACKCGKEIELPSGMLLGGHTTSCGCLNVEILQHRNRYEEGTELRQALEERIVNLNSASGYVGVQPKGNKWTAYITYRKKKYYLGTYSNIEDAIKARARAKEAVMEDAARIYDETNHLYGESPRRPLPPKKIPSTQLESTVIRALRTNNTSGYQGVTRNKEKWSVSISVNKYRYRLGVYDDFEDAVAARKKAESLVQAGDLDTLKAISTNLQICRQNGGNNDKSNSQTDIGFDI